MYFPSSALYALDALRENGYESYLVGGCVRDMIMGKAANDFDITTNALPEQIDNVFRGHTVIETGKQHGTITVLVDQQELQITTYRIDGDYNDNRHPENVEFTNNLKLDLSRRDFTINAMAYYPEEIVDLFGGEEDIRNKTIRCVGDPAQRFSEDALRILRGVRFCSTLGFSMEPNTKMALLDNKHLLKHVSAERIQQELNKLICGQNASKVLEDYKAVIEIIIPEIDFTKNWFDFIKELEHTPQKLELRLALMLNCSSSKDILKRLRYSNKISKYVLDLVSLYNKEQDFSLFQLKKLLNQFGEEIIRDLVILKNTSNQKNADIIFQELDNIINNMCWRIDQLEINGDDLIATGIPKGKIIGEILNYLLEDVMDGKLQNEHEPLIESSKIYYNQIKIQG